jgi:hypothetical protein
VNLEDKRVAVLGLAFKPGTDDVRFSPALALARRLIDDGAQVVGFDPQAAAAQRDLPELQVASDPYEAATDAHCLVVATECRSSRRSTWPVSVTDGVPHHRRRTERARPRRGGGRGFTYYPTGRPPVLPTRAAQTDGDGRPLARTPDTLET